MRYSFLLSFGLLYTGCISTHQTTVNLNHPNYFILNSSIRILDIDPLGNLYITDGNDRLSKYDTTGQLLSYAVYNNLGRIHSLDVGNPFKTMLFYRDQQTIVLFDRTLSEIQRIRLSEWGLHDVTAVCLTPDNAIWLFDGLKKVLIKTNQSGDVVLASDPFDIIRPESQRPDLIYDADHLLLLKEEGYPLSVFDDFGKYIYTPDMIENENFSVSDQYVVMSSDSSVVLYDITNRRLMPPMNLKDNLRRKRIYLFANHFYISDDQGVYILYP